MVMVMVMHRRLPEVEFPGVHGGSIHNLWPEQLKTLPEAQKGPRLLSLKLELSLQLKRIQIPGSALLAFILYKA